MNAEFTPKLIIKCREELKKELKRRVELRYINKGWYAYTVSSVYNKQKKRPDKTTNYLGAVTDDGRFIAKKERQKINREIYEYGSGKLLFSLLEPSITAIKQHFPGWWQEIVATSIIWTLWPASQKSLASRWEKLHLSKEFSARMSDKVISKMFEELGKNISARYGLFSSLLTKDELLMTDLTNIFTYSDIGKLGEKGHNPDKIYMDQINLLVALTLDKKRTVIIEPLFGSMREGKSLSDFKSRLDVKKIVFIADRGFASYPLMESLANDKFFYLIVIRKNFTIIDYTLKLEPGFFYKERPIKEGKLQVKEKNQFLYLFEDPVLKGQQESLLLKRLMKKEMKKREYKQNLKRCGRIAILSNLDEKPENIFYYYKHREDIETAID